MFNEQLQTAVREPARAPACAAHWLPASRLFSHDPWIGKARCRNWPGQPELADKADGDGPTVSIDDVGSMIGERAADGCRTAPGYPSKGAVPTRTTGSVAAPEHPTALEQPVGECP